MPVLHFDPPEDKDGGGSRRDRKRQQRFRYLADLSVNHLFFVLPSPSLAETAHRLELRTQRPWTTSEVSRLQTFTRDNVLVLGWMVTLGIPERNPAMKDNFFPVVLNRDGTYWSDYEHVRVLESQIAWINRAIKTLRRMMYTAQAQGNHTLDPVSIAVHLSLGRALEMAIQCAEHARQDARRNRSSIP